MATVGIYYYKDMPREGDESLLESIDVDNVYLVRFHTVDGKFAQISEDSRKQGDMVVSQNSGWHSWIPSEDNKIA